MLRIDCNVRSLLCGLVFVFLVKTPKHIEVEMQYICIGDNFMDLNITSYSFLSAMLSAVPLGSGEILSQNYFSGRYDLRSSAMAICNLRPSSSWPLA